MLTYTTPDGKQWEVVAVRKAKRCDLYIHANGCVYQFHEDESVWTRPIVRPIVPEWIVPTDEHAKQRPMVEVRDRETQDWRQLKLLAVLSPPDAFIVCDADDGFDAFRYCRMRNPEYKDQP